jgi:hypothetical protein
VDLHLESRIMRKRFVYAAALTSVAGAAASAQSINVTQSIDPLTITVANSVSCNSANPQRSAENSYYRSFDLTQFPQVTGPFNITTIEVGVESAVHPLGEQEITINFYVDCNGGAPNLADLTLVGSFPFIQIDTGPFVEQIPVDVTVCADATLVVEVFTPDYTSIAPPANAVYFIGSNALGETGPSYIRAPACGLGTIGTLAAINFPDMHIVMSLLGDPAAACVDPCVTLCPCACDFDTSTGPNTCDIFDFLGFQNSFVGAEPCACDIDTSTGPATCDIFDFLAFQNEFVGGCP